MSLHDDAAEWSQKMVERYGAYTDEDWKREEDAAILRRREGHQRQERLFAEQERERLASYGIPAKDIPAILDGKAEPSRLLQTVNAFTGTILVLSGGKGIGKTFAASYWLAQFGKATEWVPNGVTRKARFVATSALARVSRYNDEQMRELECARRLVIDDLSIDFLDPKGAMLSLLDGLIDARYRDQRPVILTTNLSAQEFKERYKERIADRVRESAPLGGGFRAFNEPSRRSAK